VVVVTGSSDPEVAERCESLGLFFGRKGPKFWNNIESALVEIYPDMAGRIEKREMRSTRAEVHERPRVLVVDDDPAIQMFLASRLGKFGVDTLYASNAVHAYRIACKARPSVVITDNFMPDGDAQYLLCRLRSTPATENIPVIVISGRALGELTEQNLRRKFAADLERLGFSESRSIPTSFSERCSNFVVLTGSRRKTESLMRLHIHLASSAKSF